MTRFIGKQSHTPLYLAWLVAVLAVTLVVMEYAGAINLIPGFGRERSELGEYNRR